MIGKFETLDEALARVQRTIVVERHDCLGLSRIIFRM